MRKRKTDTGQAGENVVDYRHKRVTRLNIPPAGLEARGEIAKEKRIKWAYNPHLAPALRFDGTGRADDISELIAAAGKRKAETEGRRGSKRMTRGYSLAVMAALARREALAGKVQMIYMDPPYGIKYASNFQPEVGRRDVKDKDEDLTREPERVKAYRDTWTLGVHSYLSYLRDRLLLCKELLADTGR